MKVAFFTGAGISQPSGIQTFRDKDGIWQQFDPMEVCSRQGYQKNPKKVLDFHNEIRRSVDAASPNAAHLAIAKLEKHADVTVITQNVDDLHERSGSSKVIKIHGCIHTAKLKRYKDPTIPWREDLTLESHPEGWERCKRSMRHDVVLFGEDVKHLKEARQAINDSDFFVTCGTSLAVFPAASLALENTAGYRVYVDINPDPKHREAFHYVVSEGVESGIPKIVEMIIKRITPD